MFVSPSQMVEDTSCMICWNTVKQFYSYAHCNYCQSNFHPNHLKIWLKTTYTCPKCRYPFAPDLLAHYRLSNQLLDPPVQSLTSHTSYNSLDLTKTRAPSKGHVAYFEQRLHNPDTSCQCIPFKLVLVPSLDNTLPKLIDKLFSLILFLLFYVAIAVEVGALVMPFADPEITPMQVLSITYGVILAIHLVAFFIMSLLLYLLSKRDCALHRIFKI